MRTRARAGRRCAVTCPFAGLRQGEAEPPNASKRRGRPARHSGRVTSSARKGERAGHESHPLRDHWERRSRDILRRAAAQAGRRMRDRHDRRRAVHPLQPRLPRALETHWLMRGPWFLRRALDKDGGEVVSLLAKDAGVHLHYEEAIDKLERSNGQLRVTGTAGFSTTADLVGVGLGLTMNIDVFQGTAIETNVGVRTNEFLETTVADVWAAGDVAEFYDVVSQRHHRMGTWDNSLNHGRHVAKNMLGAKEPYVEVPTYASGMFNSNISVMGVTTEEEPDAEAIVEFDLAGRNYKRLF